MAGKIPYISSGGPIVQAFTQFRRSFPAVIDASTLKKLGLASNNESYLINILRFLSLIDDEGKRTKIASEAFVLHKDDDFQNSLSDIVRTSYSEIFDLHDEDAWTLDDENLITYFRQTDQSTEIVGKRQALTFKALAGLSGKRELSAPRTTNPKKTKSESSNNNKRKNKSTKSDLTPEKADDVVHTSTSKNEMGFGLTVRVEINLPSDGSQSTYDRIFKSIKENLIDAYKS
ncbi:MAG: DUF5343 domain-containing protein [Rhodobacterales bacterium]|nr:DUF5343 domain-containing protein [Rhodobacterales bacterium]